MPVHLDDFDLGDDADESRRGAYERLLQLCSHYQAGGGGQKTQNAEEDSAAPDPGCLFD
jgi:hypothetical protein